MFNPAFFEDSCNGVVREEDLKSFTHLLIRRLRRDTYITDYTFIDSGIMFGGSTGTYNVMAIFSNKVEFNGICSG
jgi:hypothetical protein